jgi:hypothetical protein
MSSWRQVFDSRCRSLLRSTHRPSGFPSGWSCWSPNLISAGCTTILCLWSACSRDKDVYVDIVVLVSVHDHDGVCLRLVQMWVGNHSVQHMHLFFSLASDRLSLSLHPLQKESPSVFVGVMTTSPFFRGVSVCINSWSSGPVKDCRTTVSSNVRTRRAPVDAYPLHDLHLRNVVHWVSSPSPSTMFTMFSLRLPVKETNVLSSFYTRRIILLLQGLSDTS